MKISLSEVLLIGISLWGMGAWIYELIKDIKKYKIRGACIVATESSLNYYHFLGVIYLLLLIGIREWEMSTYGNIIVTVSFVTLSAISVYRALRKQGIYEKGICIPEQNCDLSAIKSYKWDTNPMLGGYSILYLQIEYSNLFARQGIKVVKWGIPDNMVPTVNSILLRIK